MASALQQHGYDVTLFAQLVRRRSSELREDYGLGTAVRLGWSAPGSNRLAKVVTLISWSWSVLPRRHAILLTRSPVLALMAWRSERVLLEIHQRRGLRGPLKRIDSLWPVRFMRGNRILLVCISENLARSIHQDFPAIRTDRVHVAPSGFRSDWFPQAWSPPPTHVRVGYFGSLFAGRGVEVVIELARAFPDVEFIVAGGSRQQWDAIVKEHLAPTNCHYAGHVAPRRVPDLLASCAILLAPYQKSVLIGNGSDTATWASPLKIPEYLAAGRVIIASKVPMIEATLTQGVDALLVDPTNTEAWETAMRDALADEKLQQRLGKAAVRRAQIGLSWDVRLAQLLTA